MPTIEVSNTFLVIVVVTFLIFRLICECSQDSHMRPSRPSQLRFTTKCIPNFINTQERKIGPLADFIDELMMHGDAMAAYLAPVRVVYHNSLWWCLDNRRLYALRRAEERGAVHTVRYSVLKPDDPQVSRDFYRGECLRNMGRTCDVDVDPNFRWGLEYQLN